MTMCAGYRKEIAIARRKQADLRVENDTRAGCGACAAGRRKAYCCVKAAAKHAFTVEQSLPERATRRLQRRGRRPERRSP
jgi:hypothetical protein